MNLSRPYTNLVVDRALPGTCVPAPLSMAKSFDIGFFIFLSDCAFVARAVKFCIVVSFIDLYTLVPVLMFVTL